MLKKTFLFAVPILILMAFGAKAQEPNYTVNGVMVSANASDANSARMQAMGEAEQKAFLQLLERLLPAEQAAAQMAVTQPHVVSGLISGYQVRDEKISARTYSASFDVSFDPEKTDSFLNSAASKPAAAQAPLAAAPGEARSLMVLNRFTSLREWVELRRKLTALPAVTRLEVTAVTRNQADMRLYYKGTQEQLQSALLAAGLRLTPHNGHWIIGL